MIYLIVNKVKFYYFVCFIFEMLAIEGSKEVQIKAPLLPTVVEPDDIPTNLFQLARARQLSPQEQDYLNQQGRYMDFVVGNLKKVAYIYQQMSYIPATYQTLGNLAEVYVKDIPYLKTVVTNSDNNVRAVLDNMAIMAKMMNEAADSDKTQVANQLALVAASEATNQALVTMDAGVKQLGTVMKEGFSKFSADQLGKYQEVLNSLVNYNGSFQQMSASFQALVVKQQQDQTALANTVTMLKEFEAAFPQALKEYMAKQSDIASSMFNEEKQKQIVKSLKEAYKESMVQGNAQIASLQSTIASQNLKLEEMKQEMEKFRQMVTSTKDSTKELEKSNQALIVYDQNNKNLAKQLEDMQTAMNATIEKAIISRDAGQPAIMTAEEGRKMQEGFNLSITNAIKSIHNEYSSTTNISKEEFKLLIQKIKNL